jgi:hypothetical protein
LGGDVKNPLPTRHHSHTPLPSLPVSFLNKTGKSRKRGDNDPFDTKIFREILEKRGMKDENIYENRPLLNVRMNTSSFIIMSHCINLSI